MNKLLWEMISESFDDFLSPEGLVEEFKLSPNQWICFRLNEMDSFINLLTDKVCEMILSQESQENLSKEDLCQLIRSTLKN